MKGDRVEIVIDAGGSTRTYEVEATRAGRRGDGTHGRGGVGVTELTTGAADAVHGGRRAPRRERKRRRVSHVPLTRLPARAERDPALRASGRRRRGAGPRRRPTVRLAPAAGLPARRPDTAADVPRLPPPLRSGSGVLPRRDG